MYNLKTYGLGTIGSVVRSLSENVVSIVTLRRHESLVVVTRLVVLAEAELSGRHERMRLMSLTERRLQHFSICIVARN